MLEEFAGLPVAELTDIRRQRGRYREAVASLSKGDMLAGYDTLASLGWVTDDKPLVGDYLAALDANRSVLVVAPTHAEGDRITAGIRAKLKERGVLGKDEKAVETLVPLGWTDAQKGDTAQYDGTEVTVFHRNSGTFRAGDRLRAVDWKPGSSYKSPSHFSVYSPGAIHVAAGDVIRITANGKTLDGHKLNNGASYRVKGFTKDDDLVLENGWTVGRDFKHLAHGYVTTSHASQGKTVDRVLIAMGGDSRPAISAEQFYVSVSRGRERATIYTDLPAAELREAIQRADPRKSATELVGAVKAKTARKPKEKALAFMKKVRNTIQQLRRKLEQGTKESIRHKEPVFER